MKQLITFILIIFYFPNFASHIIGGKFIYKYLGAGKYEIKLIIYRDCGVITDFDNPAYISIFNKSNNSLFYNKGLLLFKRDTIKSTNANPCFVPPKGICVESGTYIDTVFLPSNLQGYKIAYQRCCRNSTVINISVPSNTGMTITTDIPPQPNNSPIFLSQPPIFICLSDTFNYSFTATDIDGDSLVYNLCTPLSGASSATTQPNPALPPPYLPINWTPPNTSLNPIPNQGSFNFNQANGNLKFKPSMIGQFGIGICVLEYRNGNLINTNRFDFQFNIVHCYLVASIPTASNLCVGLNVNFQNASTNATYFSWNFGDLSTLSDTSHFVNPSYSYPNYGTYTVSLTAVNNTYGNCVSTATKVITINPLLSASIQPNYSSCYKNNNFNLNIGGIYHPSATFYWNNGLNSIPNTQMTNLNTVHFTNANPQNVFAVISQFGCTQTLVTTVTFTNPIAKTNKDKLDCFGQNLVFPNLSTGASSFFWDFGDLLNNNDTSSLFSPTYFYPNFNTYTVTLIAKEGICYDTIRIPIIVNNSLTINPLTSFTPQCHKDNSFNFIPSGIFNNFTVFNWTFQNGSPPISNSQNPLAVHFNSVGTNSVNVSISQFGCVKTQTQTIQIVSNPKANISISDSIGCQPLLVKFTYLDSSINSHSWIIDNNFSNDSIVNYLFSNSGAFSFTFIVKDSNNCTDTLEKKNFIKVHPKPIASSILTPLNTTILNPIVSYTDITVGTHTSYFTFGDGFISSNYEGIHTYNQIGQFEYNQIVVNIYGCSDTLTNFITIEGIPYGYVPNVFTPNKDNINDIFKINGEFINNSSMLIFNRWGGEIFNTKDAKSGWDGTILKSNYPAPDGTYFYVIDLNLKNGKNYKFKGEVSLFR